jgi:uncharacterized membrane protein (UPF0136 family)
MGYFSLFYGVLTIIGGVIGYATAGSPMSLIAGSVFGLLIIGAALAYLKHKPIGYTGLIILSVILAAFFGYRYTLTEAMMPAGMMVILSIANLVGLILQNRSRDKLST